jgi:hypothetical protein
MWRRTHPWNTERLGAVLPSTALAQLRIQQGKLLATSSSDYFSASTTGAAEYETHLYLNHVVALPAFCQQVAIGRKIFFSAKK